MSGEWFHTSTSLLLKGLCFSPSGGKDIVCLFSVIMGTKSLNTVDFVFCKPGGITVSLELGIITPT